MFQDFLNQIGPSTVGGLTIGAIYALVALGYTMVYGVMRLINFAHSEIFMIGTVAVAFLIIQLGISGEGGVFVTAGVLIFLSLVAMAASGGAALILERLAYRPLRKKGASRLAFLISAIGASFFLQELFAIFVIPWLLDAPGRNKFPTPRLVGRDELFTIGNATVRLDHVVVIVSAAIMMIVLDMVVNRTRMGRGIRATAQDPPTAVLMGVNIDTVVRNTFLLGGASAGVAAVLYLTSVEISDYRVGFILGIKAFTAAVLGGIGNVRGALVGGVVLGVLENWGGIFFGDAMKDVVAFTLLVVVLMFRPTGILGESLQQARA